LTAAELSDDQAKSIASALFNRVWQFIDNKDRSEADELEMIHAAHASRWHWQQAGGPKQWAIGEWQCARVYCEVGFPELAIFHAQACLELTESNDLEQWMLASAYEVLARAYWAAGDLDLAKLSRGRARQILPNLPDDEDTAHIRSQVAELTF
jgi:hypothetical protein